MNLICRLRLKQVILKYDDKNTLYHFAGVFAVMSFATDALGPFPWRIRPKPRAFFNPCASRARFIACQLKNVTPISDHNNKFANF